MQIHFSIDSQDGDERTENYFTPVIADSLKRFEDKLTRIDVRIADDSNSKSPADNKRCVMEAHPAGLKPIAVTNHADSIEKAIKGAIDKLKSAIDHTYGKMQAH